MYNPSNLWMFKHHCRRLISFLALAFLQCKIMLLWHGTKSMNLDTMPCVGPTRPGIFIWRPPWSLGKVKSAVDVLGAICQASLLHLTKAAVSRLNSFSGQIITGPEKARGGARVHSISLKLFSLERSLFFFSRSTPFLLFHPLRIVFGWCCQATCCNVCLGVGLAPDHGLPSDLFLCI